MKKIILFILLFLSIVFNAQEKKYLSFENGSNGMSFYIENKDGSFSRKNYAYVNFELKQSNETYKPRNEKELNDFLKRVTPIEKIKTDDPRQMNTLRNKPFFVTNKTNGNSSRYVFYSNYLISEANSPININDNLIIMPETYNLRAFSDNYKELEYFITYINGINFLVHNNKFYLFQKNKILENLFPDSEIKFTDKKFANFIMPLNLKKEERYISDKYFYSLVDNLGNTVLPFKFQNILVCADAILAKENDLWYFYNFYGEKIIEKGYRKILPLKTNYGNVEIDKRKEFKKGILKYVVLEQNELKIIDNIYNDTKNSDFITSYALYSICGTRSGSWSQTSNNLKILNNNISINSSSTIHNAHFVQSDEIEDEVNIKNIQTIKYSDKFGKISYLNKEDSLTSFGKMEDGFSYFLKKTFNKKENIINLFYSCNNNNCKIFFIQSFDFPHFDKDKGFDKIEDLTFDLPMLTINGDYLGSFSLATYPKDLNNNFYENKYYFLYDNNKIGYYSPRANFLPFVKARYVKLEKMRNRFMRFTDDKGKKGWLSEDGDELYDK